MKTQFQVFDFEQFINNEIKEDHRISDQIVLMDEYQLNPVNHCEFIASENIFIEVLSGRGYVEVNGSRHHVSGHSLITYLKGQKIKVQVGGKKAIQRGATFADTFMEDMYMSALKFNDIRSSVILNPVVHLESEQIQGLNVYVSVMKTIAAKRDNPNALMCAKQVTLALFYGPLFDVFKKKIDLETLQSPSLASRFFSLLEKHYLDQRDLSFYAGELNITKSYLYRCVLSTSGKAPGYWENYYLVSYAKKELANMKLTVLQIALKLQFAGLPQFSRFFKKQTGISPSEYRKSLL